MKYTLGERLRELPGPLLLTGHTGFKGTWMTLLLEHLDVPVIGYSLPPEKDSLFDRLQRTGSIPEEFSDIRNYEALDNFVNLHKPSTIIHMAAQPLVLESFQNPHETFEVNVMGTVNVLDVAFKKNSVKAIIVVTTDKVYKNDDSRKSFVESDPLEGKDPYSASKVGCEAVVSAWQQIAETSGGPKVVTVRAGNVIGGGDYGKHRLIPDAIRSYLTNKPIYVRNPESTRPWQHVLDPLSGYLQFIEKVLFENCIEKTLNFGPNENSLKVRIVIEKLSEILGIQYITPRDGEINQNQIEAKHLSLNTNKALEALNWIPTLSQLNSIDMTTVWWQQYFSNPQPRNATKICRNQIQEFLNLKFMK